MTPSIPTLLELHGILLSEEKCLEALFSYGILNQRAPCAACGSTTKLSRKLFRCKSGSCGKSISIFNNSFFANSRLKCSEVLLIGYLWLSGANSTTISIITGHSSHTIADYLRHFQQLVASNINEDDAIIGGPNIVVEIDESKMGKRKYHQGHRVEGVWVVGGIERTTERKMFATSVQDRTQETLLDVITRHVAPGSIIHTDLWRGYYGLDTIGMTHRTVNHSRHFVDPETGVHTNTIEGTWNGIKLKIAPRNRTEEHVDGHLLVFIWKRNNIENLWVGLLDALRETAFPNQIQ